MECFISSFSKDGLSIDADWNLGQASGDEEIVHGTLVLLDCSPGLPYSSTIVEHQRQLPSPFTISIMMLSALWTLSRHATWGVTGVLLYLIRGAAVSGQNPRLRLCPHTHTNSTPHLHTPPVHLSLPFENSHRHKGTLSALLFCVDRMIASLPF